MALSQDQIIHDIKEELAQLEKPADRINAMLRATGPLPLDTQREVLEEAYELIEEIDDTDQRLRLRGQVINVLKRVESVEKRQQRS